VKRVLEGDGYWRMRDPGGSVHGELLIPMDGRWKFNGDFENPTFTPSMKETWSDPEGKQHVNHFIVTAGSVAFCGDCTHSLAGKTLPLLEFSDAESLLAERDSLPA
jgi:hypothetical protein